MKVILKVIGPSERLKGLHVAKGTADGKDCMALLSQKGGHAALVCHSAEPSTVGNGIVISWSGNTLAEGAIAPGREFEFAGAMASTRPMKAAEGTIEERMSRLEDENKELKRMLQDTVALIEAKAEEAPKAPEKKKETAKPQEDV